jgi:hypothetical protein
MLFYVGGKASPPDKNAFANLSPTLASAVKLLPMRVSYRVKRGHGSHSAGKCATLRIYCGHNETSPWIYDIFLINPNGAKMNEI